MLSVIGEKVLVQNLATKLWDREAVVTGVRTSADKTIVSYNLDIAGLQSTRHRKFLRKVVGLTDQDEAAVKSVPNADERSYGDRPGQWMSYAKPEASALLCQASVWGREEVLKHGFRGLQLPGSSWCLFCNHFTCLCDSHYSVCNSWF